MVEREALEVGVLAHFQATLEEFKAGEDYSKLTRMAVNASRSYLQRLQNDSMVIELDHSEEFFDYLKEEVEDRIKDGKIDQIVRYSLEVLLDE